MGLFERGGRQFRLVAPADGGTRAVAPPLSEAADRRRGRRARARARVASLRRPAGAARGQLARRGRDDPRPDRPERRRQDHAHQRRSPASIAPTPAHILVDGQPVSLRLDERSRAPRHRPHLPDHQAVRRHDGAGARHGRLCAALALRHLVRACGEPALARGDAHNVAGGARADPLRRPRTASRIGPRTRSPTAIVACSRSPERSPCARASCCSTSRPPGLVAGGDPGARRGHPPPQGDAA